MDIMRLWLALFSLALAVAENPNIGKKVKCFMIQESVVCPGCNVRAGLSCPRRPEDKPEYESCEIPTTETPTTTTTITTETTTEMEESTMENSEISHNHVLLYLYRYMGPPVYRRKIRSVDEECRWHGDCPCPLLCCRRGKGCPRRCTRAIKLHPHVGFNGVRSTG